MTFKTVPAKQNTLYVFEDNINRSWTPEFFIKTVCEIIRNWAWGFQIDATMAELYYYHDEDGGRYEGSCSPSLMEAVIETVVVPRIAKGAKPFYGCKWSIWLDAEGALRITASLISKDEHADYSNV